jgi:uncharacterized RDD family membrane protein YckC
MGRWDDRKDDGQSGRKSGTSKPDDADFKAMTPLQRYLAKQASQGGARKPADANQAAAQPGMGKIYGTTESSKVEPSGDENPAIEAGIPFDPSQVRPAQTERLGASEEQGASARIDLQPGDFFPRFGAFIVDFLIVSLISLILRVIGWSASILLGGWVSSEGWVGFLFTQLILFVYYGWFYHEMGATPGKMLFGLEVVRRHSGGRLSYLRSYLREVPGKFISGLPFLAGYLLAAFRKDHLALHDMIFETRVVRRPKSGLSRRDPAGLGPNAGV